MTIKEVSELNYLYDLSGLSLIDLEGEVIFVNDNTVFLNAFVATTNRDVFAPLVREKINSGSNIKNGDIVLITDENFTQKVYLLITIVCGAIVPYPLYLIDYENGNEQIANFDKSDVEMLMGYPMFQDEAELTFFITKMRNIFAVDGSTSNRASIKSLNIFLDKGLWAYQNQYFADTSDIANKLGLKLIGSQPFGTVSTGNISIEFFEKDGKYVSIYSDNSGNVPTQLIIGSYELVKQAFCEIALSNSRVLYTPDFGGMFTPMDETLMQKLTDFEASITNLSKPKPIQKTMQEVTDEIVESQENPEPVIDIFAQAEAEFEKAEKETKKEKKKKRQDSFEIKGEITQKEKELAIKETIMDEPKKILIPKKTKKQSSASADKQLEQKLNSTQESYPTDWDYIYTIEETSKRYNYTVGQRYDDINDQMIIDDNQTRGMTIEEWNAYFRAHPELSHLIESTIGHLGGLFMDEKTLIDAGLLLYNPKKMKFDYVHEYVIGNVYKLIEEFEAIKDGFVQTYGESLYEKQLEILLMKRPTLKSISAADPKDVPYIHPLDEVIIDYKINTAANITFTNNQSNRIINSEKKRLEDEIKSGNVDRKDYESLVEEFGGKLQSLSIVVFFRQWLTDQIGKLASYGLPDIEIVDGLYFFGMSYPTYAAEIASRGLVIIPADKEAKDVISYSDYYEAKDSAKRFVNELFQEFLLTQVNEDDRKNIEYAWNKRYNGYVTADVWKLPIFIRHSKYFKDRTKRYKLKYSDIQISGIKFATIDNSSIMAQEVGYGKTLIAIGYMSHCFETGQASNFLVTVPKTLYVNKKWREELVGNMDESRNRYIIGAVPQYNVIELGNFSTSEIFGKGDSKYKAYSKEEKNKISELFDLLKEVESQVINKPYDYKTPVANSKYAWNKLVDTILPNIDKNLMNRSLGKQYLEIKAVLDLLGGFSITQPANPSVKISSKVQNLSILCEKIIELKWFYQKHLPTFGPDVEFKGFAAYDEYTRKQFDKFRDAELPNPFEKDENGKFIWVEKEYFDADGVKQVKEERKRRPLKDLYEEYILSVLSDLQKWAVSVIQKMSDFAIYEFGQWKFSAGTQNIILSTKEALENLGFSSQNISGIVEVVKEITTYKNEDSFDIDKAYSVTFEDEDGKIKQFRRNPEKVLQKQLNDLIDKITQNMTEEGLRGKFFLDNLKIDGFILDEAHIAKKIFTNVKTNAYVKLNLPDGRDLAIRTTSHDIKGGSAPDQALAVFGVCQYIRSIGNRKPIMLLTATPFSNQPTEIFSMLSLVGINQLREYGISNIKNFFDLFLKETLKFDFDHNGDFIKRITVEDFRNKEMLINLIWSVMDIRRESSLDKKNLEEKKFGDKPAKIVFPKLIAESSMETVNLAEEEEDLGLAECEKYGNVNTIAVVNKLSLNTCSIVDQNDIQKKMLGDIEKVVTGDVNPNTQLEYTFDDICPNVAIYNEIEKSKAKVSKSEEEEERETITVALRTILNTNVRQIPNGINVPDYVSAEKALPDMEYNSLVFVENDSVNTGVGKWAIYKKIRTIVTTKTLGQQYSYTKGGKKKTTSYADDVLVKVTDQDTINETLKTLNKKKDYGVTFKALGMSRAIALSPYFFRCNELPEPTAENVVKYSPKLEYLVKSLKSVKDYHLNEIPKRIKDLKDELSQIESIKKPSQDDMDRKSVILKDLPGLEAAREISGQVVYMNMIRFNYYSRTSRGKADVQTFNMAQLLKEYLVKKGWFTDDEVQIISSDTRDKTKEQFIKDFQDGKIKVLFGTPAIKEGVDLQNKASTMYIMTPDWNPTDMRQVEGRIWRRDNENKFVRIVYVLLDQSIEVFIYAKLEEKSRRLQQIMKERNTIEELEEMSLNPNETKVALASDPEKRADIVTKLCQAILFDQRNKVNKSREELNKLTAELDTVYQNLSIIKENYLLPYHEEIPEINKRIYEKQIQNILNVYKNDKPRFIAAFADYTVGAKAPVESTSWDVMLEESGAVQTKIGFSNPALLDHTLTLALNTIMPSKEVTIDSTLVFFNTNNETLNYIFNAFEVCIQNRDAIVKEAKQNHNGLINASVLSNYITDINEIDIVKFDYRMIDSYLFGGYKYYFSLRIFKLPYIMFAYTDNMRMELMQLLKEIKSKNPHKYEIRNMFENLLVKFNAELNDYAYDSPLIKPENYWPYVDARESKANAKVMITDDKFEAMDLLQKVTVVRDLYYALDGSIQNFIQLSADSKRELLKGKNTNPLLSEVLIKLNLADEDKTVMGDIRNELSELFKPVLRIKNTLQEIEMSFLKARGLSINDLPILAEQQNKDYDAITDKIKALEASRQKLIERFKKASEFRKLVNIDQIVDSFSKSNTYLEKKLSRPV